MLTTTFFKSYPLLKAWNGQVNFAGGAGLLLGFLAALFMVSVPFAHDFALPRYARALTWSIGFLVVGLTVVTIRFGNFQTAYSNEMKEDDFREIVKKRVFTTYLFAFFATTCIVIFTWFFARTQIQWTETVVLIAECVVFFGFSLFSILNIRDENADVILRFHALPELEEKGM